MASNNNILKAATEPDPESISYQVKYILLFIYGIEKPQPDSLANNAMLANFHFNDFQWMELAKKLNTFIHTFRPDHFVSVVELQNLITVQDCINLVLQKIK